MLNYLNHPSVPFLTAAVTALLLYRGLEIGLGLSGSIMFAFGLGGAAGDDRERQSEEGSSQPVSVRV